MNKYYVIPIKIITDTTALENMNLFCLKLWMCSTYHHMDLKREFDDLIIFGLGFEYLFELV